MSQRWCWIFENGHSKYKLFQFKHWSSCLVPNFSLRHFPAMNLTVLPGLTVNARLVPCSGGKKRRIKRERIWFWRGKRETGEEARLSSVSFTDKTAIFSSTLALVTVPNGDMIYWKRIGLVVQDKPSQQLTLASRYSTRYFTSLKQTWVQHSILPSFWQRVVHGIYNLYIGVSTTFTWNETRGTLMYMNYVYQDLQKIHFIV